MSSVKYPILIVCLIFQSAFSYSQYFKIDTSYNINELVNDLLIEKNHHGIIISNIQFKGNKYAKGAYFYESTQNILPPSGIVLSTGQVQDATGNSSRTASSENYTEGDIDLSKIVNSKTYDAASISFDFISLSDSISFDFFFASEEYPEYVNKGVSDIFGFFIADSINTTTVNVAKISNNNTPITIDLINKHVNSEYYVANNSLEMNENMPYHLYLKFYENNTLFTFDGFTKPITTGIKLIPYREYQFKMVIADVGDRKYDSWIFMKGNSFASKGSKKELKAEDIKSFLSFTPEDSTLLEVKENTLKLFAPIYFNYDSYKLSSESEDYLEKLSGLLLYATQDIIIRGYADKSGKSDYNLALSEKRANEVMKKLIACGVEQSKISAIGMGEIENELNHSKSRKVEIDIIKKAP